MDQAVCGDVERPRGGERSVAEDAPLQAHESEYVGEDDPPDFSVEVEITHTFCQDDITK
jgi:hypothetical protein